MKKDKKQKGPAIDLEHDEKFQEFRRRFLAEPGLPASVYPASMKPMGSYADDFPDRHHNYRQEHDIVIYTEARIKPRAKKVTCLSPVSEKSTEFIKKHWPDVEPIPEVVSNAEVDLYPVPNETGEHLCELCNAAKLKVWVFELRFWEPGASKKK